jgi:hypothetical protein
VWVFVDPPLVWEPVGQVEHVLDPAALYLKQHSV